MPGLGLSMGITLTMLSLVVLLPIGVALAITSYWHRLRFVGRFVAVLGFAAWVTLAFASPSATSILIDIILAVTLLLEIISRHDC
jgi:hypothetical protein